MSGVRERGAYVVQRPDAEELAATKAWWNKYNFTAESSPGVMKHCDQSYGCLAWWAYEREVERNKKLRAELRKLRGGNECGCDICRAAKRKR